LKILILLCTIGSPLLAQTGDSAPQNRNEVKPWPTTIKVVTVELQSDVTLPPEAVEQLRRYITGRNIEDSPDWVDELEERAKDLSSTTDIFVRRFERGFVG